MAFDISQLFGQGAINRLMTSQLTGPQSTFTNQNVAPSAALPQPAAPAPLMQNVPGSLSAGGLTAPRSAKDWTAIGVKGPLVGVDDQATLDKANATLAQSGEAAAKRFLSEYGQSVPLNTYQHMHQGMQNVPGSLAPRPADAQPADPWSGMRQANAPSQQTLPDDLGDKLVRGLHNFANSSSGQWLNNMFAGWAQGSSPQDSIAKGGMSVANGTTRNHTVDLLVKNGFDPQSAQGIAGNPDALNAALKTVMDRQNPDHQLQVQKTQAEINKINAEGLYYGGKGGKQALINAGNGNIYDPNSNGWITAPNAGKALTTVAGHSFDPDDLPAVMLNDQGVPDRQAQKALLDNLPPSLAAQVQGISEGRMALEKVTSMKAGERQKMAGLVSIYDPTFDMTKAAARMTTAKDYASGGKADVMKSSTNMAIQHAALMYDHAVKLHNSAYPMYNWAANTIGDNLGNKELQDNLSGFMSGRSGFGTEVGKAFHGAGAVPEAQVEEWKNQLSPNNPPNKIRETVEAAMHMLAARTESYNTSYKNNMGRNAPDFLTPNSIAALKRMGISTNVLGIPDPQGGGAGHSPSVVPNNDGSVTIDGYKIKALKG